MGDLSSRPAVPRPLPARLQALHDWLEQSGVDVDNLPDVGRVKEISGGTWTTGMKVRGEDGVDRVELVEQKRAGWVISPSWETGPEWPLPQPGPEFTVAAQQPVQQAPGDGWRTLVCLPDIQAPFQDEQALDVALQIVADAGPDVIVLHGDNLDLEAMSRFRQRPGFAAGTQHAIDRMTLFCAELRATAPTAHIVWLSGNHETRLENYVLDNAAAAFGVRVGRLPGEDAGRPVLDVPTLCRLGESGVDYIQGHPAGAYWFQPNVRVVHGHYTGNTAVKRYLDEGVTTVWGHTHHRAWADRVLADGRRIFGLSAGCLCSVDGSVPGTMTGYDWDGPVRQPVSWDQGVLVARGDGETFWPELVPIVDGAAWFRGQRYEAG